MNIEKTFPPNIALIREKFTLSGREIFTYGNVIHNPGGGVLGPELIAHESVHSRQQKGGIEKWWDQYLVNAEFRLNQEVEAHREEYRVFRSIIKDRGKVNQFLQHIAFRLASPMYGSIVSTGEARRLISKGIS